MCRLQNIAMRDYQESVTTGQTHGQTPDKVIPMCRFASNKGHFGSCTCILVLSIYSPRLHTHTVVAQINDCIYFNVP